MLHALLIDDDEDFLSGLAEVARQEGFEISTAGSLKEARERLAREPIDIAVVDLALPDGQGVELLHDLEDVTGTDVVIISGAATVDSAIEALRHGALDYLTKPIDLTRLRTVLANCARMRSLKQQVGVLRGELRKFGRFEGMIGASPAMQRVYDLIAKIAPTDVTVLITGESGTGKECVAQAIFELSPRRLRPFIPLNCGAVSPTLIESELFGHERGSFTGATQMRRGLFERASGGTLFLDEITEMPIELQVKLLRVLESGTLTRVGGESSMPVNVRMITACNRPPLDAIQAGMLREDLYYRLNVFPIDLPPLRERGEDSLLLADSFLQDVNQAEGSDKRLSAQARQRIRAYSWPGNVRELKNEMRRAFILADDVIEFEGLATNPARRVAARVDTAPPPALGGSIEEVERDLILATLDRLGGDKKQAAGILGISLKTLYNRLNQYARN